MTGLQLLGAAMVFAVFMGGAIFPIAVRFGWREALPIMGVVLALAGLVTFGLALMAGVVE